MGLPMCRFIAAACAVGLGSLYFRSGLLIAGAATLIYRIAMPVIVQRMESRGRSRLRQDTVLWLEELTMALKAGKSLASATIDLALRLTLSPIERQDEKATSSWKHCLGMMRLNYPVGQAYRELAARLAIPELGALAALIGSAVRTGANLPRVFILSAAAMRERLEGREALESALASRRIEGYMLAAAPAVYTAFLRLATPAYMAPLYTSGGQAAAAVVFGLQLVGCRAFFRLLLRDEEDPPELALAGFQEEIALQLQAGLSLPEAWQQAAHRFEEEAAAGEGGRDRGGDGAGIRARLSYVARQSAMGAPFARALDHLLQEKGGATELKRLAELLRQNYQSGGGALPELIRLEAKDIRQRCMLGRQARDARRGTLLLFPMVLLLLSALLSAEQAALPLPLPYKLPFSYRCTR
jgi:tight adherence protein B